MLVTTGVAAPRGSVMDCGCAAGNWRAERYADLRQHEVWCVCVCAGDGRVVVAVVVVVVVG